MKEARLLHTIEVSKYPRKVQLSKARRKLYYKKGDGRRIPTKYFNNRKYNKKGYLIDPKTNKRVIRNPRVAGKPRFAVISGNNFASGYNHHVKKVIVKTLKDFYRPFLINLPVITTFPLRILWDFYGTFNKADYDLSNLWFYYKYFEDCLFEERVIGDGSTKPSIIPDDSVKYVTQPGSALFHPVESEDDSKFIFKIYQDLRPEIQSLRLWNKRKQN